MDNLNALLAIITGLVLRIGLPIAATGLAILLLRKLDNHWRAEAKQNLLVPVFAASQPCWEVKKCSQEQRKNCLAAKQTTSPCWQFFRNEQGTLKETCLGCEVFRHAPLLSGD